MFHKESKENFRMANSQFTALSGPHAAGWATATAQTEGDSAVKGPIGRNINSAAAHATDPLACLPKMARTKFQELTDRLDDARTLTRATDVNELIQAKMKAAQRVKELTDPITAQRTGYGAVYGKGHAAVDDAEARLAKAAKELERAQERADAHSHRS